MNASMFFDHVSVRAPLERLVEAGFRLTETAGSEGRHRRIPLHGSYLEVDPVDDAEGLELGAWFLRPDDIHAAADWLRENAMPVKGPTPYRGHDGTWLDLEFQDDQPQAVLPLITQRIDPQEPWPPTEEAHPNGAVAVDSIDLATSDPGRLTNLLGLCGARAVAAGVRLEGGTLVVMHDRAGVASIDALTLRRQDGTQIRLESGSATP